MVRKVSFIFTFFIYISHRPELTAEQLATKFGVSAKLNEGVTKTLSRYSLFILFILFIYSSSPTLSLHPSHIHLSYPLFIM